MTVGVPSCFGADKAEGRRGAYGCVQKKNCATFSITSATPRVFYSGRRNTRHGSNKSSNGKPHEAQAQVKNRTLDQEETETHAGPILVFVESTPPPGGTKMKTDQKIDCRTNRLVSPGRKRPQEPQVQRKYWRNRPFSPERNSQREKLVDPRKRGIERIE